jgi:hypothetical protein
VNRTGGTNRALTDRMTGKGDNENTANPDMRYQVKLRMVPLICDLVPGPQNKGKQPPHRLLYTWFFHGASLERRSLPRKPKHPIREQISQSTQQ